MNSISRYSNLSRHITVMESTASSLSFSIGGYSLPKDVQTFLSQRSGDSFPLKFLDPRNELYPVERVCDFNQSNPYGIHTELTSLRKKEKIFKHCIPIMKSGSGDYLCLDFSKNPKNPSVVYWSHDDGKGLHPITKDFKSFLRLFDSI